MTTKQIAESVAQITVPVPVGISGLTFIGITLKDWVLIGTAVLLVFQLIVMAPRAYRSLKRGRLNIMETMRNGKSK